MDKTLSVASISRTVFQSQSYLSRTFRDPRSSTRPIKALWTSGFPSSYISQRPSIGGFPFFIWRPSLRRFLGLRRSGSRVRTVWPHHRSAGPVVSLPGATVRQPVNALAPTKIYLKLQSVCKCPDVNRILHLLRSTHPTQCRYM